MVARKAKMRTESTFFFKLRASTAFSFAIIKLMLRIINNCSYAFIIRFFGAKGCTTGRSSPYRRSTPFCICGQFGTLLKPFYWEIRPKAISLLKTLDKPHTVAKVSALWKKSVFSVFVLVVRPRPLRPSLSACLHKLLPHTYSHKRDIVLQVFTELYIENGELKYKATEAYQALLMRFDASISLSCGEREIRTPDTLSDIQPFQGCRFNRSRISPDA